MPVLLSYILSGLMVLLGVAGGFFLFYLPQAVAEIRPVFSSITFQAAAAFLALYVTSSSQNLLAGSFLLTVLSMLFLRQYQDFRRGELDSWFKPIGRPPTGLERILYFVVLGVVFLYSLVSLVF